MTRDAAGRLVSLDVFRGATVAAMILVNNPGDWGHVYWPLDHAPWHGWTPTDLIFPFFLFAVGISVNFSSRLSAAPALRRTAVLIGLGLFMAAFPYFHLSTLRWPGVLQRIALCYFAAWAARRFLGVRGQAALAAGILVAYWLLMTQVPGPGGGPASLEPETNLAARIDRVFLTGHMWRQTRTWDPEGLLSTLPAAATTVLGLLAGEWLRSAQAAKVKAMGLLAGGLILVAAGLAWGATFPINKNLWTSSYVLFTGGMAAYALGLLAKLLIAIKLAGPDGPLSLQAHIYRTLFRSWAPPIDASLLFALANVAFYYAVLDAMDRRGVRVKV